MKHPFPLIALALAAVFGSASAAEFGSVISSTPVTQQVGVPQQTCTEQQQLVEQPTSGGGAVVGAVVGGLLGNTVGRGLGRAAATGIGVVAGAAVGDHVEAGQTPPAETTVRSCQNAMRVDSRVIGYDVVYEYHGQRYSSRLVQDPGSQVPLNVQVTPAVATVAPSTVTTTTVIGPPPVVYADPYYGHRAYRRW
jgi:uncharacterized protein YcfJ